MAAHLNSQQHFGENKHDILGLKPDIVDYLTSKCRRYVLESSCLLENHCGITLTLKYITENSGKNLNKEKNGAKPPVSQLKKRKSPSRRKRDRERLISFRKRKLDLKNKRQTPNVPQCSPPQDETITVPNHTSLTVLDPPAVTSPLVTVLDPPSVTLPPQLPSQVPKTPVDVPKSPNTVEPLTTSKATGVYCLCDVCNRFNTKGSDTDPISEQHVACNKCGKLATFMEPLKPCSRCVICAYCSKDCQRAHWPDHKPHCKKETGVQARELRAKWHEAREVWLEHIFEPLLPPTT